MEMILNFFENQVFKKSSFDFYISWKLKRIILNIVWGLLNIFVFISVTNLMVQMGLEVLWLALLIVYASIYWIISTLIFDTIIGDEIDNKI